MKKQDALSPSSLDSSVGSSLPAQERRWAVHRLILGQLQIVGAVAGAILLLQTGVNTPSVTVIALTSLVMVISRLLFRKQP